MVFSHRPIQWKGHSRLTRARCFLGKQSSPLPTAAEHEVVEAPLATKEDDIPNETHHAFQSTIQTLRKRTRKKSSSIERRDAESTQVAVAMEEKEEKNAAMDKVDDCKPVHKYDEVMSLKPTDTDSFETASLKSVIQQQPVQLVCEVVTEAKPTVMPKSFESMHRRTQTKQVTRESPGLSIITSEFPDDSLEPSFEVDLHEQPLSVVVLQEPAIPNTIEVVFESNPAERKVNITPSSYNDDSNYDRNAHLSVNNDVKDLPEAVGTTTYKESGAVNAKGESEILPRIGSNEKEQSAQMAPAVIESQENEPHPVFQQQAAQNRSFATFNETAPPSAATATATAAAVNSLLEIGGCGGLTTMPSRSKPELSLTISRQEADVAVDADSYLKQDLEVNTDDDLRRHKSEECVDLKSDKVESETQSAYFSTYYNPTTPPSPDTIIEVDPNQFNAEVCQAMKDFDEDALSRPQSCLLTECLSDNDTSTQHVTFVVEPERRAIPLPIESCSVSRDDHSIHDGVVVPSDSLLRKCDDANNSDIGIVSNHPWVAKANKDIKDDANDVTNLGTVICGDGSVEVNDLWSRNNSDSKDAISDSTDHCFSSNKSDDDAMTTTAAAEAVTSSFDKGGLHVLHFSSVHCWIT